MSTSGVITQTTTTKQSFGSTIVQTSRICNYLNPTNFNIFRFFDYLTLIIKFQ